jgi:hypothetical protein
MAAFRKHAGARKILGIAVGRAREDLGRPIDPLPAIVDFDRSISMTGIWVLLQMITDSDPANSVVHSQHSPRPHAE